MGGEGGGEDEKEKNEKREEEKEEEKEKREKKEEKEKEKKNKNKKKKGVKLDNEHWYDHLPKLVKMSREGTVTVLWIQQVQTRRAIPNNKTHIIKCDNEK